MLKPFHIVIAVHCFVSLLSAGDERGAVAVVNYPTSGDYREDRDAWSIVRSRSGLMYAANSEGVLRYNGVSWKLIRLPNRTSVQSLAIDREGRIMVGSDGEIGMLEETGSGHRYTSFLPFIPESLRNFSQTWTADTLGGYSYLQTSTAIFVVHGDSVSVIPAPKLFGLTYRYGGRLLVQDRANGLMALVGRRLIPFDSSRFMTTTSIAAILPGTNGRHFLFTKYDGMFLYDGTQRIPVRSPMNDLVMKFRPYRGSALTTGENAVGLIGLGMIIFDSTGSIRTVLNKENGLMNTAVTSIYDDGYGNLWITGYHGISRMPYPAPLTLFAEKQGLSGAVKVVVRHQGRIYAGTIENLFVLGSDPSVRSLSASGTSSVFTRIPAIREDCSFLLSVDDDLLVSTTQGVFVVNGSVNRLVTGTYALPLLRSYHDPDRVFIGTFGLGSMVRRNGVWKDEGLYEGIREDVYQIFEQSPNVLWLRTYNQGILRVTVGSGPSRSARIERYGTADGLPSLSYLPASIVEGRFIVPTESGIMTFDERTHRFVSDTMFLRQFPGAPAGIYAVDPGSEGRYWMLVEKQEGYSVMLWKKNPAGTFEPVPLPFSTPAAQRIEWVMEDVHGVHWLPTSGGLYRYDPTHPQRAVAPFRAAVDRVRLLGNDSLLIDDGSGAVTVEYNQNSFRFSVSANSYMNEMQTRYQYRMEGFDEQWSSWTTEKRKEYTNLDPGRYTLHVRAQDPLGRIGAEAVMPVEVLPPWWGTWWFRSIVALIFLTAGPAVYYWRVTGLQRENRQQEEFTRQLINRQESERKRIAHELHDSISQSLLSIKNRAAMAAERSSDLEWMKEQINVILSSSSGAIQEIKQITHNLRPYLLDRVGLTRALQSLLRIHSESSPATMIGAVDEIDGLLPQENEIHLYRIVQEALNNIAKHAGATEIHVAVEHLSPVLRMEIRDNGKGFDQSVQRDGRSTSGGLGLEGIAERARILGGTVSIDSGPGNGTRLTITIPLKDRHG